MKLIQRDDYLTRLKNVEGTPDIKVITGIRRCGKSKLLDAFSAYIEQKPNANVIRVKLNLKEFEELLDADKLYDFVNNKYKNDCVNYLFIDEIQMCKGFERVVNSFYEEEKYDIYITGSNAFLLSSDLATLFGGRVFEISLYPFSFAEYIKYYSLSNAGDIDALFNNYFHQGGMSGSYLYRNQEDSRKYIQGLYQTTIIKDIIQKFNITNESLLNMLIEFLMDNIGSQISIRNIANKLTSSSFKTNDKTIGAYILYLVRSFMFYPIKPYDIRGKKYLEGNKKYYLSDLSFRHSILGNKNADWGHLYENLVAIELLRRGFEVYVGKLYDKEIDFVAIKNGHKTYIQVSDDITNPETFNREISPLLKIKDAYPKILIAQTKHDETNYDGVRIIDIARWLASR